jgi:hypothetical protein
MEERNKLVAEAAKIIQPLEGVEDLNMAHKLAQEKMMRECDFFCKTWVVHICFL